MQFPFTPKLVTQLREGYSLAFFRKDALAGLTVAIVALPLSMAIAIASHAPPAAGLFTAIVGGFLISALGGSRFQIGGPAGAFIVLVSSIIDTHGMDGLMIATMMAGLIMIIGGLLRLGSLVRHVPHAVTVGFTAGIAVIIFASQIHDLLGLTLSGPEPGELLHKLETLWAARTTINWPAALLAAATIAVISLIRSWRPLWPSLLIAVVLASVVAWAFQLPVETIGSRFGAIPSTLPLPSFPAVSLDKVIALLPSALSLAVLGSIESLLSAVVADSMTGRMHRSNAELVAQGAANVITPLFGGITVTGTIARTATNVKAGAHGPVSGMMHALYVLVFMLVAAPLMSLIPLAALAGILALVAWNMVERKEIMKLGHWAPLAVLLVTFLITIFRDLIEGIAAGIILSLLLNWLLKQRKP
ncbi:MAG: sodium-independent anion transporter [Rhizobiales bacterium]|nr:sodium-independent anion transporter [Hyphomicrobiales bacterium]